MLEKLSPIYRWIAAAIGLLIAGFLIWYFSSIVFYILIAAVLSLMGRPLVTLIEKIRIHRWGPPRWLAAMITLIIIMSLIFVSARLLIPVLIGQINQLAAFNLEELIQALSDPIGKVNLMINDLIPGNTFTVEGYLESQIEPFLSSGVIKDSVLSVTGWIIDLTVAVFAVAFITFFFLKDDSLFFESVVILFPARYEENIQRALDSSTTLLIRYFIGICIEMIIKLICITLPMYLIGFEFHTALTIGIIAAVLNVIPYIGPLIGGIIGCVIGLLLPIPGIPIGAMLAKMIVIFFIFQVLDNMIIQPYIYASSVKAHPLEIFLVILAAGYLAGILGMLFAIPAYTVIRVFAKEFFNNFRVVQKLTEKI